MRSLAAEPAPRRSALGANVVQWTPRAAAKITTKSPSLLGLTATPLTTLPFAGAALLGWLATALALILVGALSRKASRWSVD